MTKAYKKGVPITCIRQLSKIYDDHGYIFLRDRLLHISFWQNIQFRLVVRWIKYKMIWEAVKEAT